MIPDLTAIPIFLVKNRAAANESDETSDINPNWTAKKIPVVKSLSDSFMYWTRFFTIKGIPTCPHRNKSWKNADKKI